MYPIIAKGFSLIGVGIGIALLTSGFVNSDITASLVGGFVLGTNAIAFIAFNERMK